MTPIISKFYIKRYVDYFSKLLRNYEAGEYDLYTFLIHAVKTDLGPTIERIKSSIEFMTFYYALKDLESKKGLIKKEDIFNEIKNYSEKLKKYVESFNFKNEVTFSCIFNISAMEENDMLKNRAKSVLDNPQNFRKFFGAETRNYLAGTIKKIFQKIDDLGMLSEYVFSSNRTSKNNGLSILMINEGECEKEELLNDILNFSNKKNDFFPITAKEIFYDDWLDKQSLEQLVYMNLFWANKFAKLIEDIYLVVLLLSKRKNLLEGMRKSELDFETLMYWINEENLTQKEINNLLAELKEVYSFDNDQIKNHNYKFVKEFYIEDLYELRTIHDYVGICYTLKKMSVFYALDSLENDREVKNYGITEINGKSGAMLAFMIDVPRYNLPISFHIERKSLYIFYTEFCKKDRIRKYIGVEDFYNEEKKWANSFLYPLTKSQREYIHRVKDVNNTYAHLDFIQTRIWPDHMKDNKGKPLKEFIELKNLI